MESKVNNLEKDLNGSLSKVEMTNLLGGNVPPPTPDGTVMGWSGPGPNGETTYDILKARTTIHASTAKFRLMVLD